MRVLFGLLALALVGCGQRHALAPAAVPPPKAVEFKQGQGLRVTTEAAQLIGLEKRAVESVGGALVIPLTAILQTSEGAFAYVINGTRLLRMPIRLGELKGATTVVTDGLFEGDIVAVAGVKYLWFAELQSLKGGVGCADGH